MELNRNLNYVKGFNVTYIWLIIRNQIDLCSKGTGKDHAHIATYSWCMIYKIQFIESKL